MKTHRHLLPVLCSLLGLCMGFAATGAAQAQVNRTDSLALNAIMNSTNIGDLWSSWGTSPVPQWTGVKVENGRVVELELVARVRSGTRIPVSGTLPDAIGDLTKLRKFESFLNSLSGEIPGSITKLTELEILDLEGNDFSGEIPENIGVLEKLTELDLSFNQLTGPIPESIGNLSELSKLALNNNEVAGDNGLSGGFAGTVPQFTNLPNLELLDVGWNGLEDLPDLTGLPASVELWSPIPVRQAHRQHRRATASTTTVKERLMRARTSRRPVEWEPAAPPV